MTIPYSLNAPADVRAGRFGRTYIHPAFLASRLEMSCLGGRFGSRGSDLLEIEWSVPPPFIMTCLRNALRRTPKVLDPLGGAIKARAPLVLLSGLSLALTSGLIAQSAPPKADQTVKPLALTLSANQPVVIELRPAESKTLPFQVTAGRYSEIHVVQVQGMFESALVDPDGHGSFPSRNDGGIGSSDRLSLVAAETGTATLRVQSKERHRQVTCRVILSAEREPRPFDGDIVQAQSLLAQAEQARRDLTSSTGPPALNSQRVLAIYDRAYQLAMAATDLSLQRQSLIGKARYQIYRMAQYQQGAQTAAQATQVSASTPDADQQALAWKTLASAQAFINRYDESTASYQRALDLYKSTGDRYWQGIVLGNLAYIYRETGDTAHALQSAKDSLQDAQELSDDYGVAFTESMLGEIYQGSGQYQDALNAYDQALDTANIVSYPQVQGEVWSDLGELYTQLDDWERAENAYHQALPIVEKDGDGINEIEVLDHLGDLTLHAGQPWQAYKYFQRGLKLAQEQKLVREETFLWIGMARACMRIPCSETPLTILSRSLASARRIRQIEGEAAAEHAIGDVLAAERKDNLAIGTYTRSAELWRQIPNYEEEAGVDGDIARLELRSGDLAAARRQIARALDLIETSRSNIQSDVLRTSYFTSKHSYYELAVDILMRLDRMHPNRGYAAQAWTVAERARARALLDSLGAESPQNTSRTDDRQSQTISALDVRIQEIEDQLTRLGSTPSDLAKAQRLEKTIHGMLLQADQVEARMRGSAPARAALTDASHLSVAEFSNRVLDSRTRLLEYWVGKDHTYLWILTPSGLRTHWLPGRAALETSIHAYLESLLARDVYIAGEDVKTGQQRIARADSRLHNQSMHLATVLLPGAFSPRTQRLIVVPDGDLHSLPFAALELHNTGDGAARYLIEQYDLVYEPSASTAVNLGSRQDQSMRERRIAIFADPVYSNTDSRMQHSRPTVTATAQEPPAAENSFHRAASWRNMAQLPRLPGSRKEALEIAQIAGPGTTSLYLDFDASPEHFAQIDWKSYGLAHFAAHAIVNTEQPEFSGIVLSMVHEDGTPADGVLWLRNIYRSHMGVSLVTLSGCQTADGKPIPGEGINGLSRAFLYAGAHSVIGTLWEAEDTSSSELMRSFYSGFLNKNRSSASALRSAQLAVLENPGLRAPYYWAGFILEGNWRGH